jgi:hypothetical protein
MRLIVRHILSAWIGFFCLAVITPPILQAKTAASPDIPALQDNPAIDFDKIVFVKRYTFQSSHFYTDFIDGCEEFGGNLCILSLKDGKVTELAPKLKDGIFGRFDLSFDAKRVVFGWKPSLKKGFRIYEVGIDGKGFRQLTFEPPDEKQRIKKYNQPDFESYNHHTDDMHPCYLPDGGICFTSSRCEYGILCNGDDTLSTTVLYRIDADGSNMEKLTNSAVSEFSPTIMPDGRILYSRWEYVDKGSLCIKALWAMHPDGTGSVEIFGNNHNLPPTFLHGRAIPDNKNMFVCLGVPHFPQAGYGTVIRIDTNYDIRTRKPMTYVTADVDLRGAVTGGEGGWEFYIGNRWVPDGRGKKGRLYADPYPLSKNLFLVSSKQTGKRWNDIKAYDLYLLDDKGNHTLIYDDPDISCWHPMPLRPRRVPPVLRSTIDPKLAKENLALCVVSDVYRGLDNVKQGTIKYIRINEQAPRPWAARRFWDDDGYIISMGTHMGLKVQHGIVPVEEDGSAHFVVAADKNIFFQVLDENFMEVQRERTYINYRPGEIRSCIGCHEKIKDAPHSLPGKLIALNRPPSKPGPQPGEISGARPLHYPTDVQPILDKHCIRCHSGDESAADMDLTGKLTYEFSRSYENLLEHDLLQTIDEDTVKFGEYMPPYSLGSHVSKLIKTLLKGHNDVKLSQEEMIKLTTWVDSNAQYYGTWYGRKELEHRNHPNFRPKPTFAEAISTIAPLPEKDR